MKGLAFFASPFNCNGGGYKACALRAQALQQFRPRFVGMNVGSYGDFPSCFGGPVDATILSARFDGNGWDTQDVRTALDGCAVAVVVAGSANNVLEWRGVLETAKSMGVLRVLDCALGVGSIDARQYDLVLSPSFECARTADGSPIGDVLQVIRLPTQTPTNVPREDVQDFRRRINVPIDSYLVGVPCNDSSSLAPLVSVLSKFCDERGAHVVVTVSHETFPETHGGRWRRLGPLSQQEMSVFYESVDVIVHNRTESFGYNVVDALRRAKPVVAAWTSHSNGFAEMMWPGGGYLARSAESIGNVLRHVHSHPEEANERGQRGRDIATSETSLSAAGDRFESAVIRAGAISGLLPQSTPSAPYESWRLRQSEMMEAWNRIRAHVAYSLKSCEFM